MLLYVIANTFKPMISVLVDLTMLLQTFANPDLVPDGFVHVFVNP